MQRQGFPCDFDLGRLSLMMLTELPLIVHDLYSSLAVSSPAPKSPSVASTGQSLPRNILSQKNSPHSLV